MIILQFVLCAMLCSKMPVHPQDMLPEKSRGIIYDKHLASNHGFHYSSGDKKERVGWGNAQ